MSWNPSDNARVPGWAKPKTVEQQSERAASAEPQMQVPMSPNGITSSGQKKPSAFKRPGGAGNAGSPVPQLKRPRPSTEPVTNAATRLSSLSDRFSYRPATSTSSQAPSTVFSRYEALLSGPPQSNQFRPSQPRQPSQPTQPTQPTQPNPPVDKGHNDMATLKKKYPHLAAASLEAALSIYGSVENACGFLDKLDRKATGHDSSDSISTTAGAPPLTAKREVSKPRKTIRERFITSQTPDNFNNSSKSSQMVLRWPKAEATVNGTSKLGKGYSSKTGSVSPGPSVGAPQSSRSKEQPKRETSARFERYEYSDESEADEGYNEAEEAEFEERVLQFLNTATKEDIVDVSGNPEEEVSLIISKRPYSSMTAVRKVEAPSENVSTKSRRRPKKTPGEKIADACTNTLRGYEAVDSLIKSCDELGKEVAADIRQWGVATTGGEVDAVEISEKASGYFTEKPALLADDLVLKDYQQVGINWLSLLYRRKLSCILADEMGLGKTCQVISFLAHLKEIGEQGPHLIVVPASTLENWLREFQRFCPALKVEPYYGSQDERAEIRDTLIESGAQYDVMVTTYNLACGGKQDLGFLRSCHFNVCVYDEGHMLKNSQSERYAKLIRLRANFRLLLTGTPLQNNLQELVSLLSFMMPQLFEDKRDDLAIIFKHKAKATDSGDQKSLLLSDQRIQKAKTMMTPFVLRRRKVQVLKHMPGKTHEVVYCEMTETQKELYQEEFAESQKLVATNNKSSSATSTPSSTRESSVASKGNSNKFKNSLMQLRKAAIHPMLFRRFYGEHKLKVMAKDIMKEERYATANEEYIYEDMEVMNDLELTRLCENFPGTIGKEQVPDTMWFDSGKVKKLQELLPVMKDAGDRVLIFSQFTQILDILERVLDRLSISYIRLDGQTPVDMRQDMIDKYHNEEDITVFLLSTKAGGFGINLACANTVIIFDLSFNPHDDKQAEDRAHRVGQTREVKVIRMIAVGTIEENILELANTKLALDKGISEQADEGGAVDDEKVEEAGEASVAKMIGLA